MAHACTFGDLGLDVGAMTAILTDRRGQPVQFIERINRSTYNLCTVKPGGSMCAIGTSRKDSLPDASFVGRSSNELGLVSEEAEAGMLRLLNRCAGHKRSRLWRISGLKFIQPERAWAAGDGVVLVDVKLFDAAWAHDDDYYVCAGGIGGIGSARSRYNGFVRWLRSNGGRLPIEMPEVSLGTGRRNGVPQFTNGRHRFSVLRDLEYEILPVSSDVYSQIEIDRAYAMK